MATLLGNRIFLEMPKQEETKLIVDENTKEALNRILDTTVDNIEAYINGKPINVVKNTK